MSERTRKVAIMLVPTERKPESRKVVVEVIPDKKRPVVERLFVDVQIAVLRDLEKCACDRMRACVEGGKAFDNISGIDSGKKAVVSRVLRDKAELLRKIVAVAYDSVEMPDASK